MHTLFDSAADHPAPASIRGFRELQLVRRAAVQHVPRCRTRTRVWQRNEAAYVLIGRTAGVLLTEVHLQPHLRHRGIGFFEKARGEILKFRARRHVPRNSSAL